MKFDRIMVEPCEFNSQSKRSSILWSILNWSWWNFLGLSTEALDFKFWPLCIFRRHLWKRCLTLHVLIMICPKFDCSIIFTRGFTVGSQKWMFTYQAHAEGVIFDNTVEQGSQLQIKSLRLFSIELKKLHIIILPIISD